MSPVVVAAPSAKIPEDEIKKHIENLIFPPKEIVAEFKAPEPIVEALPEPIPPKIVKVAKAVPTQVSDAKMFIYNNESGNNPARVNGIGCIGLGQACPSGAKPALLLACPNWATDYACQDVFWENQYMKPRYGTWENAKAKWLWNCENSEYGCWW